MKPLFNEGDFIWLVYRDTIMCREVKGIIGAILQEYSYKVAIHTTIISGRDIFAYVREKECFATQRELLHYIERNNIKIIC